MTTIEITYGTDTALLECDLSRAEVALFVDGESTPYQTADARHRTDAAVLLAARYVWPECQWPEPVRGSEPVSPTDAWDALEYQTID